MEDSPRVLLADTIGFIDHLPSSTLDAFRATLAEALECDLLLILSDVSDAPEELERKLFGRKIGKLFIAVVWNRVKFDLRSTKA